MDFIKNKIRISKKIIFLFLIFFTFFICFFKLGHSYLENWDEGFYAQVTKEMIQRKEPFVLYWNGEIFLDKSPLNFWLNTFFVKIFGLSEFSTRLVSAISGFITIIIIFSYAFKRWGIIPALFSFSALVLNNIYIWRVRTGNLDALLTLFFVISYLLIISKNKNRYFYLGVVFALIYLQKLTIFFLPLAIFIFYELLTHKEKVFKKIHSYLLLILVILIIDGIWLLIGWLKVGAKFPVYYLFKADQGVGRLSLTFFKTDYLSYTYYSLQRRLIYPFIIGTIFLIINIKKLKNLVLLLFSSSLIILLSFTQQRNNWYLVPSMPFWALTIGYGVNHILIISEKLKTKKIFSFIILLALFYISFKTFSINIMSIINQEASISEVKTARLVKKISQPKEPILRLDYAYPVTLFYADRKTFYYVNIDQSLIDFIKKKKINYLLGKKEKVKEFVEFTKKSNNSIRYQVINVPDNDEAVIKIIN